MVLYLHWLLGWVVLLGAIGSNCLTTIRRLLRGRVRVVRVHVVSVIGMRHVLGYEVSVD